MTISVKQNNTYAAATGVWVKVNGVWKQVASDGLDGLGGWAEVTSASVNAIQHGDYDRYIFKTTSSHYITLTEGIAAILLVGGGGGGRFYGTSPMGGHGGSVQYGLHFFSSGRKDITVGDAGVYPLGVGGLTEMTGVVTPANGGGNAAGNTAGDGAGGPSRTPNGGVGVIIEGVEYGRGGYAQGGAISGNATEKPSSAGTFGWGASGTLMPSNDAPEQPATGGLVMVDVLRKTTTKANAIPPFGWPIE